ncbi:hypothetical protein ACSBOB_14810 [Mesorhizobium sp. ASY16-5R]|uniref:hypothetical protein n=1 Tax=Mesorhizobium sp. ASY16-5R TaxID=3445772 RepID=UPI003F9F9B2F
MREVYKQVRNQKRDTEMRMVIKLPVAEVDQLDTWAAAQGFSTRKAALRHLIREKTASGTAEVA